MGIFHYTGEKQDTMVSINDKISNFFNGIKNERAWMWTAAGAAATGALGGLSGGATLALAAGTGLITHLMNGRFLPGKSVPAPKPTYTVTPFPAPPMPA